jgi:alpha-amylase
LFSILSCQQFVVGSNGSLEVEYSKGGMAHILVPRDLLENSGICTVNDPVVQEAKGQLASSALSDMTRPLSSLGLFILFVLGLFGSGVGL